MCLLLYTLLTIVMFDFKMCKYRISETRDIVKVSKYIFNNVKKKIVSVLRLLLSFARGFCFKSKIIKMIVEWGSLYMHKLPTHTVVLGKLTGTKPPTFIVKYCSHDNNFDETSLDHPTIPLLHTLLASACLVSALWLSRLYVVSSHSHVAAGGPGKCCWQYIGRVELECRKQQGLSSLEWKMRSLPCNSVAEGDIIRLWLAIRQVIPPTDCNL